jgi:hypothetical protein
MPQTRSSHETRLAESLEAEHTGARLPERRSLRMWSKELRTLSEEYLNYDGTHVKSINGQFGVLSIDYQNELYTISIKPDFTETLTFHSVNEIIESGWAVD